jgi:deoxyribose-phosphate aldolase
MSTASPADIARRAITLLDLTELGDGATDDDVRALCGRAVGPHGIVAAVCVWPRHVALAHHLLANTGVRIATVVNFPSGDDPIDDVVSLTGAALADGADEIDLVLPYRAFLSGEPPRRGDDRRVRSGRGHPKVILGRRDDADLVREAAELAVVHGADFIKTAPVRPGTVPRSRPPR